MAPALSSEAISGTVTDGTNPIQNATVQAWQNNQKIQGTTTAQDGSYTLSGLAEGIYIVRAHIDIYDIKGKLVRRLDLGRKEAGYYLDRRSAARWDGRSQTGEKVASGIYLYTIKAGKFTATRRMVMVK